MLKPDMRRLRLTLFPPGAGPHDRYELIVEATGTVIMSGRMPYNEAELRETSVAYHEQLDAVQLAPKGPGQPYHFGDERKNI